MSALARQGLIPIDQHQEEAALMRRAQADPAAFAPLYERYVDRMYAYCYRRTGNAQDAEDLCSQIFTHALTGLPGYRGGMVAAWLFQIARNTVAAYYREKRPALSLDDLEASLADEHDGFQHQDDSRLLADLIAGLPRDHRDLLALALDAELDSAQIGAVVGKQAGAVRVQLHRIFKHLREKYHASLE